MASTPRPQQGGLSSHDFGRWGESVAAEHYQSLGFDVIERNWRCPGGEIDLIMAQDAIVVFVEVKTRASGRYGSGAEAVGWRKQQTIRTVALQWLSVTSGSFREIRFDVAAVNRSGDVTVFKACF